MLIFDGDCGFCRRSLGWARRLGGRFEAVPAAALDPATLGLTRQQLTEAAWFVDEDEQLHRGHEAVARVLMTSRWLPVRLAGRLVGSRVMAPLASRAYAWVADHRGRFPRWLG